jgi:hypothetical protein
MHEKRERAGEKTDSEEVHNAKYLFKRKDVQQNQTEDVCQHTRT